ncbi:wall-associated receptor kinase 2 [Beta vulgaris subsp. vulgaris]|uniref:wall-associated receptor kinase 2 n=1 Tax=Beta vulgaris subsp. vulgaris TaxID=3555 RepID=UPI00254997E3|nr:wall-associated receptor kinase 2 [Beta vulgaris subsp. vulgaris]
MVKAGFYWVFPSIVATITIAIVLSQLQVTYSQSTFHIARPNCTEKCGDVEIPYPFGIGDNCHYDHPDDGFFYNITCNENRVPAVPTYGNNIEIEKITLDGEFRVRNYISYICYDSEGVETQNFTSWIRITRFALSTTENIAGAIGCDTIGYFTGTRMNSSSEFGTGCVTACSNQNDVGNTCSGIGCCLATIPDAVTNIRLITGSVYNHTAVHSFNPCSVAFVVARDSAFEDGNHFSINSLLTQDVESLRTTRTSIVYDWSIGTKDCDEARATEEYICNGNSMCIDNIQGQWGYRCQCNPGFQGNPYLHDCRDINECVNGQNSCEKQEYCVNGPGNYSCNCPAGYEGRATKASPCTPIVASDTASRKKLLLSIKIIVGVQKLLCYHSIKWMVRVSMNVKISWCWKRHHLLFGFCLQWQYGNKKLQKMRETFFLQNGGHILRQKLLGRDVSVGNMVKMFTVEELKKATDNYSETSIIGRGGFGMVYKGILSNKEVSPKNQVVAIKRSIKVDSSQAEQFINEVVALSQINNKNVVKLLGCCLETEVPLLVYEYISNGTLHDHLHDEGKMCSLTWKIRLKIAAEVAEVLAYLHNTISIPIIHRDIKSANILLDDNFTAKVADFGASKLTPTDNEQLATMVQGTCGYLDPEYMQTGELTDKSDVYSFGVVLVELLTREKAISYAKPENERCLAVFFLRKLKEDRLIEILDDRIMNGGDGATQQLKDVANLARKCLKLKGDDRPAMKEVARELEVIKDMGSHPWSNSGVQLQEENEHLLGETNNINTAYGYNEAMNDSLSSQSRIVQLVPLNGGR